MFFLFIEQDESKKIIIKADFSTEWLYTFRSHWPNSIASRAIRKIFSLKDTLQHIKKRERERACARSSNKENYLNLVSLVL